MSARASRCRSGRLALWLIEGYGRGRLIIDSPDERDSFVLDTRNLKAPARRCRLQPGDLRRELHRASVAGCAANWPERSSLDVNWLSEQAVDQLSDHQAGGGRGTGDAHGLDHGLKRTALAHHATADPERHQ